MYKENERRRQRRVFEAKAKGGKYVLPFNTNNNNNKYQKIPWILHWYTHPTVYEDAFVTG